MGGYRVPYSTNTPYQTPRNSIAALLMRQGEIQAEGASRSGMIWADVLNRLGALPAQYQEQKQRNEDREVEREQRRAQTARIDSERKLTENRQNVMSSGGGRERVIQGLMQAGDLEGAKLARESFEETDKSLKRHFGTVASKIRAFKDSPDVALVAIDDMAEQGFDPKHFEKYRAMIQENPASVTQIVDFLLRESPDEEHRKQATPAQKQEGFTLRPGETRFGPDNQPVANVPGEPPKPPQPRVVGRSLVDDAGKVLYRDPDKAEAPKLERVETTDDQGKPITRFVTPKEGDTFAKPTGAGKPATGQQRKALSFFNRGKEAQEIASSLEEGEEISPARIKYTPDWANVLQSNPNQAYTQAQRAFTEARLRKESGAAVPEKEYENDAKTYFAQPGDSKQTLAQKRAARNAVLAGIAFEAGDALKEFYGDEAEGMVASYRNAQKPGVDVSPGDIEAFAKEEGISYEEALKRARREGYKVR